VGTDMVINQMLFECSILPVLQRFRHSHGGTGCGSAHKPRRLAMGPLPI